MNDTNGEPPLTATRRYQQAEEYVREHPGSTLLIAIGAGAVIGLLAYALRPAPQDRIVRLLEDIEDRLHDITEPALRKAGKLAAEGMEAAHSGEAWIERMLGKTARRARRLFS